MDRDDAAFVANVLERRIEGAREDLERTAASSFAVLLSAAAVIKSKSEGWEPGLVAAAELERIATDRGAVCDAPAPALLQPFIESMRRLADEQPTMNRADRRKLIAAQPRGRRLSLKPTDLRIPPAPRLVH